MNRSSKITLLIFFFLHLPFLAQAQEEAITRDNKVVVLYADGTWKYADSIPFYSTSTTQIAGLEIPALAPDEELVIHTGYTLVYNEAHEQASWVAYELAKEETVRHYDRTDKFLRDPKVKTGTADNNDYSHTGYDRGHLAPASDMGWSLATMTESFFYSNISPQEPSFNRGIWKKLEELVRTWAVENEAVYVVTGPVLNPDLYSIGANQVSIPKYFYKVILDYRQPSVKAIGFILPNRGSKEPLTSFALTIDAVEATTGIDFFPLLDDEQENYLEKTLCIECWSWQSISTPSFNQETTESVTCRGKTKAGEPCKNRTLNPTGYCHHHINQHSGHSATVAPSNNSSRAASGSGTRSVQCAGRTKAGSRCKRMTTNPNGRCYQH